MTEEKNTLVAQVCLLFRCMVKDISWRILLWVRSYLFLKNYDISEEAVSHNVLHYQQLSITRYQVNVYANNYFELIPIVSSVFNMSWFYQLWAPYCFHKLSFTEAKLKIEGHNWQQRRFLTDLALYIIIISPRVTIAQRRIPKDHTSLSVVYTSTRRDSSAIQRMGRTPCNAEYRNDKENILLFHLKPT